MNHQLTEQFKDRFKKSVNAYQQVNDDDFDAFFSEFEFVQMRKGEVLLREGEVCRHLYFIISGGIRCFLLDENGKEVNLHFYFDNDLASEFRSLHEQTPSTRNLVTLAPTKALRASKPDYYPHFADKIELVQAAMRFFQEQLFEEEAHAEMLRKLSAEERYQYVLEQYPEYLQKVSLTQLASWLGISRESLSRIRNKLSTASG